MCEFDETKCEFCPDWEVCTQEADDIEHRYTFNMSVYDNYTRDITELTKGVSDGYCGAETELGTYLKVFEDFLRACTFVLDGCHLELVED